MGTRNTTMVISNGATKVAQYGQWDGYPGGQGATALKFLKRANLKTFKEKVDSLGVFSDQEIEALGDDWKEMYGYLSRDLGADILNAIMFGEYEQSDYPNAKKLIKCDIKKVRLDENFPGDSLFCEWCYVVDLDKNTFEVYEGFNKTPLTENDRFFPLQAAIKEREEKYYPVKLVKSYPLDKLPTDKEFIADFENAEA